MDEDAEGEIVMVELRWTTPEGTTTKPPKLQWRSRAADPWGRLTLWTEWQDVPTVLVPREPATWVCPNCGIDRFKAECPKGYGASLTGHCLIVGKAD